MRLPNHTLRLFAGYDADELVSPQNRDFLMARLLEEGDGEDLRWWLQETGETSWAEWLSHRGGRQLSRRSRAFWTAVLGRLPGPAVPGAEALWPL